MYGKFSSTFHSGVMVTLLHFIKLEASNIKLDRTGSGQCSGRLL